jgi:LCP family protein required for cell wall assembly
VDEADAWASDEANAPAARLDEPAPDFDGRIRRRRRRILAVAGIAVALVLVLGLVTIDGAAIYRRIDREQVAFPAVDDGITTWLLIGSDSRAATATMPNPKAFGRVPGERADVILLVQQGRDGGPARILTVPRDLVVFQPGRGAQRVALTLIQSIDALVGALCGSLGVAVDHVALVRIDGIGRIVDEVGGVPVDEPLAIRDRRTGLELPAGRSVLDGPSAVSWVRARHVERAAYGEWVPDDRGEQGRQENQRMLLDAVSQRAISRLRRPWAARSMAEALAEEVVVDDAASIGDLTRLGQILASGPVAETVAHRSTPGAIPVAVMVPEAADQLDAWRGDAPAASPCPRARPQPTS